MRLILVLLTVFLPEIAQAQRVIVRSGEHSDFSRLAFEFTDPVEWKMGRVAGGYEIRIKGSDVPVDISSVYRRISRSRIKNISVSSDNSRVTLLLGCDCHADAFEFRPGLLVVDIKEGPPTDKSEFEVAFRSDEITDSQHVELTPDMMVESEVLPVSGKGREAINSAPSFPVLPPLSTHQQTTSAGVLGMPTTPLIIMRGQRKSTDRISEMQSEMLLQIGRAAAQGLLNANLPNPATKPHVSEVPKAEIVDDNQPVVHPNVNIRIENSVDREVSKLLPVNPVTATGGVCLHDKTLNVAEWGDSDSVWRNISKLRGSVSGEFDKADARVVEALAKAYIYAGFGAEANSVIIEFNAELENKNLLMVLAKIVDGLPPDDMSALDTQSGCDSAAALWAVLAMSKLTAGLDINRSQVIGTFSGLPIHLRRFLGPSLAQKFLEIGDIDTARALRNAIARSPGSPGPRLRLLDARLDRERGYNERAEQTLKAISSENSEVAIEAMIEILQTKLQQNETVGIGLLNSAETFLQEQKTTQTGADLLRVVALVYAQSGNLPAALEKLREIEGTGFHDKNSEGKVWEGVLESAVSIATDEAFLRFIFSTRNEIASQHIPRTLLRRIVGRVVDIGLPELAKSLLGESVSPTDDDQILLARVAILERRPKTAVTLLEHVSGKDAARLRAYAFELMKNYADAAEEYASVVDGDRHHDAVWRGGDWRGVQETGSETEKIAARIMTSSTLVEAMDQPLFGDIISHDKSLIEESENLRRTIEDLLKEYPPLDQKGS